MYDEIVIVPLLALEVFTSYGLDYEQDNEPQSFADTMRRPDYGGKHSAIKFEQS